MFNHRILHVLLPLAVVLVAACACTDDQKRALGEEDVRDSLHASVERVLEDQGDAVGADGLDCTSSINAAGEVAGTCAGTTEDGDAIAATYVGTADIDAETCVAELTMTVGEAEMPPGSGVDCFAS